MTTLKAVGCHVFAGGFTDGVAEVFDVDGQLETCGLGEETVRAAGREFFRADDWRDWLCVDLWRGASFMSGNPRCSGFSCTTAGFGDSGRGPNATATKDAVEFCRFGAKIAVPIMAWESVQQAYTTAGRPLLRRFADDLIARGYRVAHVLTTAGTFGNAQRRARYFFVAYRGVRTFNVWEPVRLTRQTTVRDVIEQMEALQTKPDNLCAGGDHDPDAHHHFRSDEGKVVWMLREGESLNDLGRRDPSGLRAASDEYGVRRDFRVSEVPFGILNMRRLRYDAPCPVICSGSENFVHPALNRKLTVRELARLMGWSRLPVGMKPVHQLGKGVVPCVGRWLADCAETSLRDGWGGDDVGYDRDGSKRDTKGETEKVIDLRAWAPPVKETRDD